RRRGRGPGDGLGGGAARAPRRPPRPRALRRGARDHAGRRDRPAVEALRPRRGLGRAGGAGRGRRLGGDRRARRVSPALMDTREAAERWRETWERCWQSHEPEPIVALYADGAYFQIDPFRNPQPPRDYLVPTLAAEE